MRKIWKDVQERENSSKFQPRINYEGGEGFHMQKWVNRNIIKAQKYGILGHVWVLGP